jgi:hypothetical protein
MWYTARYHERECITRIQFSLAIQVTGLCVRRGSYDSSVLNVLGGLVLQ